MPCHLYVSILQAVKLDFLVCNVRGDHIARKTLQVSEDREKSPSPSFDQSWGNKVSCFSELQYCALGHRTFFVCLLFLFVVFVFG